MARLLLYFVVFIIFIMSVVDNFTTWIEVGYDARLLMWAAVGVLAICEALQSIGERVAKEMSK